MKRKLNRKVDYDGISKGDMVMLKIEPIRMRLMNKKGEPPKELDFPLE